MKLIIQIPCFDEEQTLPETLADLPARDRGHRRGRVARDRRRLDRPHGRGRARGRRRPHRPPHQQQGPRRGLPGGARRLPQARRRHHRQHRRRQPVPRRATSPSWSRRSSAGDADMVIGDRETDQIEHFSPLKKRLQRWGSAVVRRASDTDVPDTTSGFRAYNREAALQMQVVSKFTYTLESIIQAGKMLVAVDHVPIRTNPQDARVAPVPVDVGLRAPQRASRSSASTRSTSRCACSWPPPRVVALVGAVIWARFLWFFIAGDGRRPHPVADPRLDAVHRRRAARRARRGRRHPRRHRACSSSASSSACAGWSCTWASSPRTTSRAPSRPARRPPPAPSAGPRHRQDRGARGAQAVSAASADAPRSRPATPSTSTARRTRWSSG